MAKILPNYKKNILDEIKSNITSNTSVYYAFASNPVEYGTTPPSETNDDYSSMFTNNWRMIFGKKIANTDVIGMIQNNPWTENEVYDRYDNTSNTLHTNNNFYVVCDPDTVGGYYHVYKCLDNNNGANSTVNPSTVASPTSPTSFTTSDNYLWRYVFSISSANYTKYSSTDYVPVTANSTLQAGAANNAGVEVIVIENGGTGYSAHHTGVVSSVVNSTLIQIQSTASSSDFFYDDCAIYFQNETAVTSQLSKISSYQSNSLGKWVTLASPANTENITPSTTIYKIAPDIVITTDGDTETKAICTINTVANSIGTITVLEKGSFVSWANVSIETSQGSGANLYAIVPPPGGHGYNPETELNIQGIGVSFTFSNNESSTIPDNILYNKIGIIKNPGSLQEDFTKGDVYSNTTFSQLLKADVSPSHTFTVGEYISGDSSGAVGIVAFSNSSEVHVVGDMYFTDSETISNTTTSAITTITVTEIGDIYAKDITPLYIQNINDIERSSTQSESYKIIIKL